MAVSAWERLSLREDSADYQVSRAVTARARKPVAPDRPLTKTEQGDLDRCENIIRRGWQSFVDVGEALAMIRDKQLFRDRYERFEDYYRAEWQYQKSQVYRLMEAAKVVRVLSPIGENSSNGMPLPICEAQVRSLVGLEESEIKNVWQQVTRKAKGKRITARLVRTQVQVIVPRTKKAAGSSGKRRIQNKSERIAAIEQMLDQLVALVDQSDARHDSAEKFRRKILQFVQSD